MGSKFIIVLYFVIILMIFLFFHNLFVMKGESCEGFKPHKMSCVVDYLNKIERV